LKKKEDRGAEDGFGLDENNNNNNNNPNNNNPGEKDQLMETNGTTNGTSSSSGESPFLKPLVYFKRNVPHAKQRKLQQSLPTQINFPHSGMALGLAPISKRKSQKDREQEAEIEQRDSDNLLVFTPPEYERSRKFICFLLLLFPVDIILITVSYARGELSTDTSSSTELAGQLTYSCIMLTIALDLLL